MNRISVLFLGIIFLLSVTGIVVFHSHCSCTGNEHVSIYITPETCEDNYHTHHIHLQGGEEVPSTGSDCHECASHTKDCGCDDMIVNFYKLDNEVVPEKARSVVKQLVPVIKPVSAIVLLSHVPLNPPEKQYYYSEPPSDRTSLDFLIPIHQLKIPLQA